MIKSTRRFRMDQERTPLFNIYLKITAVVLSYWFVSIVLVFVNKYLLNSDELKLDAPLFVTWFQSVISLLMCALLTLFSIISIPFGSVSLDQLKQVFPLSCIFVAMVTFNNLCLQYVGVSFYYIGRSLTTVFNVILAYVILKQTTSAAAMVCCVIIIFGFFLGVDQEKVAGSLSLTGVFFGVLASLFVALNSIYIKKMLPYVQNDVMLLTFYNNLNAAFLFVPFILLNGEISRVTSFPGLTDIYFWMFMLIGGIFGFAIGFLISLQIKLTSPLTNNISGTAKACAQTILATMWYKETKSVLWWTSNGIVLLGSAAYTRIRQMEMKSKMSQKPEDQVKSPA